MVVIVALAGRLPETLALVLRSAFSTEAVKGGALGSRIGHSPIRRQAQRSRD